MYWTWQTLSKRCPAAARATSPCAANNLGWLALPGVAFSNSPEEKGWFASRNTSHPCKAVGLKNLIDLDETNGRLTAAKVHVNWAHPSASHLKRTLTDADGAGATALKAVGSAAHEGDVCAFFGEAPHLPVAGTSLASAFCGKILAGPSFFGNLTTIRAMDLLPRLSASLRNPLEAWDATTATRITVCCKPRCAPVDSGG